MREHMRPILVIFLLTFLLTAGISAASKSVLQFIGLELAILLLFLIVFLGVFFDIVGTAATAAAEDPFNAMAAKKVYGAKTALRLVRNSHKVASVCNDMIGDICGTVAGALGVTLVFRIFQSPSPLQPHEAYFTIGITSVAAALTVAGKAGGKRFAIRRSTDVILLVGKALYWVERTLSLKLFEGENNRNGSGKARLKSRKPKIGSD